MRVHAEEPEAPARPPRRPPAAAGPASHSTGTRRPGLVGPAALLGLQRRAGNAAVVAALSGDPAPPVQRRCACGGGKEGEGPCESCS